jgi:uncharacterized protein YceH (UPF0502 family)
MIELTPDECRVLGVLIEKESTTPEQYPLSLNAIVNGCNQKNNRDPVTSLDEQAVYAAVESMRLKKLVVLVDALGSRVNKYRHNAADTLRLRGPSLAILAELLLRGPQTLGELRGRASRMTPMESLDVVKENLRPLMEGDEPMVVELPPSPGSRAERYMQRMCPDLHGVETTASTGATAHPAVSAHVSPTLTARVESLEIELAALKETVRRLSTALGEPDSVTT